MRKWDPWMWRADCYLFSMNETTVLFICCRSEHKVWSPLVTEEGKRHPYKMNLASEPQVSSCSSLLLLLPPATFQHIPGFSCSWGLGIKWPGEPSTVTARIWLLFISSRKGTVGGKGWKPPGPGSQPKLEAGVGGWLGSGGVFLCAGQKHGKVEVLAQLCMDFRYQQIVPRMTVTLDPETEPGRSKGEFDSKPCFSALCPPMSPGVEISIFCYSVTSSETLKSLKRSSSYCWKMK